MLGGPQDHPQFQYLQGLRTEHEVILTAMIYYSRRIQSKISKGEKAHGVKSEERHTNCQEYSPSRVTWGTLNLPSNKIDNICDVLSSREAHWRLCAQSFYWRLVTQASFCLSCTKNSVLQKKRAGVQYKPYYLHKQIIRHSQPFLSFLESFVSVGNC